LLFGVAVAFLAAGALGCDDLAFFLSGSWSKGLVLEELEADDAAWRDERRWGTAFCSGAPGAARFLGGI
jgi:hypothetical protein